MLRRRIETKAFAYGVSSVVATLLAEYVIDLLRIASAQADTNHANRPATPLQPQI